MSEWPLVSIRSIVEEKEIWNSRLDTRVQVEYLEISGIDNSLGKVIRTKTIQISNPPSRAKKLIRASDIVFGTTRPYLKNIAVIPENLDNQVCSTGFCVLRPQADKVLTEWLFAICRSDLVVDQVTPGQEKHAYPAVSDDAVLDSLVPLPDLSEQRRIVARIEELTSRAEEARKLRQEAVTLSSQWLIAVVRREFDLLAEHHFGLLGELASIIGGSSLPEDVPPPDGNSERVGLMKVADMNSPGNEKIIKGCKLETTFKEAKKRKLRILPVDSIVFPKRGGAIATNKKRILGLPAALDPNLMGVFPFCPKTLKPAYLRCWFESIDLASIQEDGGIPQVNKKHLAPLEVPLPSPQEQQEIASKLHAIQAKAEEIIQLQHDVDEELAKFQSSLLAKAFRGEL
ncbi:MAG: restriction endonuclease subunit S [Lentisphaeria bacterium]|jgi:type I restriction enzyme S subunit